MADTYSQIYIQIVFAVRNRDALIRREWEEQLYKYITGIVQNKGQKMLAINGVETHIHFLIGMKPSCCLSELVIFLFGYHMRPPSFRLAISKKERLLLL